MFIRTPIISKETRSHSQHETSGSVEPGSHVSERIFIVVVVIDDIFVVLRNDIVDVVVFEKTYYLLKKSTLAYSAKIQSQDITFGSPEQFSTVNIAASNIAGILDVKDSDLEK